MVIFVNSDRTLVSKQEMTEICDAFFDDLVPALTILFSLSGLFRSEKDQSFSKQDDSQIQNNVSKQENWMSAEGVRNFWRKTR